MDLHSILHFMEDKAILVTGATGFLGKVFIEKILRVQPNMKKVYLLLRDKDQISAEKRFKNEIIAKDLFRVLKMKYEEEISSYISDKVQIVCGDLVFENFGVKDSDLLEEMWEQIEVVVNFAAYRNYFGRYDVSLQTNTFGVMNLWSFCKKCNKLTILVHVSTAYVSNKKEGLILEEPLKIGESGLDIFEEKKLVEQTLRKLRDDNCSQDSIKIVMKNLGLERARKFGWPDTYHFTKAMGEMLLEEINEGMPIIIIRSINITSTYKEPFPGWIEGVGLPDHLIIEYGKGNVPCYVSNPDTKLHLIPADMAVNVIIVAMAAHKIQPKHGVIYNVGSFGLSPLLVTWIFDYSFSYYTQNPLIDKHGKPIIVERCTIFKTRESLLEHIKTRCALQNKELEMVKIKPLMKLVELGEPFSCLNRFFDDTNTEMLRKLVTNNGMEMDIFYFNPKVINWEDYFMGTHIRGVLKYLFLSKL